MKEPKDPTEQPKDLVADALTDRNADPDALTQEPPLKVHGDALLHGTSAAHGEKKDDVRRDER